jgi:hypothetical protein
MYEKLTFFTIYIYIICSHLIPTFDSRVIIQLPDQSLDLLRPINRAQPGTSRRRTR